MALTFTKQIPSGVTTGILLPVVAVASPGTLFHQVQATGTDALEMVYLDAVNTDSSDATLNVEVGSTGTEDFFNILLKADEGLNRIVAGWALTGTDQTIRAFATATGIIRIGGWINRAT